MAGHRRLSRRRPARYPPRCGAVVGGAHDASLAVNPISIRLHAQGVLVEKEGPAGSRQYRQGQARMKWQRRDRRITVESGRLCIRRSNGINNQPMGQSAHQHANPTANSSRAFGIISFGMALGQRMGLAAAEFQTSVAGSGSRARMEGGRFNGRWRGAGDQRRAASCCTHSLACRPGWGDRSRRFALEPLSVQDGEEGPRYVEIGSSGDG